ncbi:hypothetical protein L916_08006, partial [Phytophthora nicotianae]
MFRACGIFPLSHVNMNARLLNYTRNGAPKHVHLAAWIQLKPIIQSDVLIVRTTPKKTPQRKRIKVSGRLLTQDAIQEAVHAAQLKQAKPSTTVSEVPTSTGITMPNVETSTGLSATAAEIVAFV